MDEEMMREIQRKMGELMWRSLQNQMFVTDAEVSIDTECKLTWEELRFHVWRK